MNRCGQCGFLGDVAVCPQDGSPMTPLDAPVPPPKTTPFDPTRGDDDGLRGANFGQWAAPEVPTVGTDTLVGKTIGGRYFVKALVGRGGMGAVYEALQTSVRRTVALKVLLKEYAENEGVIRRFHQEALAASRLAHPNTIKVYDFGQTDGLLYIAMEFLEGETVAQLLHREGVLPPRRALGILRQVCKSLAEAHKNGIIHRDLKPENIFLTDVEGERDFAKVLDFGVAKLRTYEDETGTLTQAGSLFGTPKYMSPEHARSGALDARADLYSVGIILYELVLGAPPFDSDNPLSVLLSQVHDAPARFASTPKGAALPAPLEAVVFKALSKDRENRYPSAEALIVDLDALDAFLETGDAAIEERLPRLDDAAQGEQQGTLSPAQWAPPVDGATPTTRRGVPLGLLAAAAVGTLVVTAVALFMARETPKGPAPTPAITTVAPKTPAEVPPTIPAESLPESEPTAPTPEPQTGVFFTVGSAPARARIVHRETGSDVGLTPHRVEVFAKTRFVLKRAGYVDFALELDPASGVRELSPRLKRRETAKEPKPPPVVTPPTPPTVVRVTPPPTPDLPPSPPKKHDVPLEFN